METLKKQNSIETQIQRLFSKLETYQLEIFAYSSQNNLPILTPSPLENFTLFNSEICFNQLNQLHSNILNFVKIINTPLYVKHQETISRYNSLIFRIIGNLRLLIEFYQSQHRYNLSLRKGLDSFNLNLIYQNSSFPNTFQKDNLLMFTKLSNFPFENKKYLITLSTFHKSTGFFTNLKHSEFHLIYQKNDTIGFKDDSNVYYSKTKEEFLNQLFEKINKLSNTNFNIQTDENKIISIIIHSSFDGKFENDPPVINQEQFKKVA